MKRFSSLSRAGRFAFLFSLFLMALCLVALVSPDVAAFTFGNPEGLMIAAVAPFTLVPELQATAMAYRNQNLIGDLVMPRVPVGTQQYEYYKWDKAETFTIPDTAVGRTSKPNQVEFKADKTPSACLDYGLDDPVPQNDINNAPKGIDPRMRAVEGTTDLIMLDRERRVANLVFAAGTYPSGNKTQLGSGTYFSDFTNSKPLEVVNTGLDTPIVRPNTIVFGQAAWTKFRQHPHIVKAMHGTSGDKGMATREFIAELFEVDQVLVGQAFLNSAKKGQTATFARVWGKHISLLYIDPLANPVNSKNRVTFGFSAQWGERVAGTINDPNVGLRGGVVIRVGESMDEEIACSDVGYFIEDAVE